jgi:hypothetical protein
LPGKLNIQPLHVYPGYGSLFSQHPGLSLSNRYLAQEGAFLDLPQAGPADCRFDTGKLLDYPAGLFVYQINISGYSSTGYGDFGPGLLCVSLD